MNALSAYLDRVDPDRVILQRFLLLGLFLCLPLSLAVPMEWGWENGVVENAQVVVLLAGLFFAFQAWRHGPRGDASTLALCLLPVWLLLTGRELSWGSVFLDPLGFGPDGPIYSSRVLWYRPLVPPIAGLMLLGSVYLAWRQRLHRYLLRLVASGRFPWMSIVLVLGAALGSTAGEGHLPAFAQHLLDHSLVLEEMSEAVGYLAMVVGQGIVLRYKAPATVTVHVAEAATATTVESAAGNEVRAKAEARTETVG